MWPHLYWGKCLKKNAQQIRTWEMRPKSSNVYPFKEKSIMQHFWMPSLKKNYYMNLASLFHMKTFKEIVQWMKVEELGFIASKWNHSRKLHNGWKLKNLGSLLSMERNERKLHSGWKFVGNDVNCLNENWIMNEILKKLLGN